jgi:DNA adenine methylase
MKDSSPLLFRYPGGKHYALNILRPFWEAVPHTEYREPFAGGGSVFFNKPKVESNWLNDLDSELITTYRVISNESQRKELVELVADEVASPERWNEVRALVPDSELLIAFKYFYLNRTSFSGKLVSAAWGYRDKRSLPPHRWQERINPCGQRLSDVNLTSLDFEEVIAKTSRRSTLLYVDPPYYLPPKHKHYRHGFDESDHDRLSHALQITPHKFFLTYDDAEEIRNRYKWANIYPVKFFYRVDNSSVFGGTRRLGFELVITNFEIPSSTLFEEI